MTWPLQPIGPASGGTPRIESLRPSERTRRRHEHGEDERADDERPRRDSEARQPGTPDTDGHIDVLA